MSDMGPKSYFLALTLRKKEILRNDGAYFEFFSQKIESFGPYFERKIFFEKKKCQKMALTLGSGPYFGWAALTLGALTLGPPCITYFINYLINYFLIYFIIYLIINFIIRFIISFIINFSTFFWNIFLIIVFNVYFLFF